MWHHVSCDSHVTIPCVSCDIMWLYHVSCDSHVTIPCVMWQSCDYTMCVMWQSCDYTMCVMWPFIWQPYECNHVTVHVTLCTWPYCEFIMWLYPMTWGLPNLFFLSLVTQPEAKTQWIQWLLQSLEENNVSSRWTRVAHTIIFFSTWLRNVNKPCAQWYCNTFAILIILNFIAIHAQMYNILWVNIKWSPCQQNNLKSAHTDIETQTSLKCQYISKNW